MNYEMDALRLRMIWETESFLERFLKDQMQHPTPVKSPRRRFAARRARRGAGVARRCKIFCPDRSRANL